MGCFRKQCQGNYCKSDTIQINTTVEGSFTLNRSKNNANFVLLIFNFGDSEAV